MNKEPEILIFGRTEGAPFHPLSGLETELVSLFGEEVPVESTVESRQFHDLAKSAVRTVVALDDNWTEKLDLGALSALERWIRGGGHLLVVHNGVCWARHRRWKSLLGASFTGHEPAKTLTFQHLTDGSGFELFEEPYRFSFAKLRQKTVLATYRDDDKDWPAAWSRRVGRGRILYSLPGHFVEAFQVPTYRRWLREWAR